MRRLQAKDISFFKNQGYLVKKAVVPTSLLQKYQKEVKIFLDKKAKITENGSTINNLQNLEVISTGFGGMIDYMWGCTTNEIRQHPSIYDCFVDLYSHTYSSPSPDWPNSLGSFDPAHMYIFANRICWRPPTKLIESISKKSHPVSHGTGFHIDMNPFDPYPSSMLFWQPIQAFISVTDQLVPNSGGFLTIPEFHLQSISYFENALNQNSDLKEKIEIKRGNAVDFKHDLETLLPGKDKFEFIPVESGDVLFWDWRMPHANEERNDSAKIRECVYVGHLPDVKVNKEYVEQQKEWWNEGVHPPFMSKKRSKLEVDGYVPFEFSTLGKKLMGITPWNIH